MSFNEGVLSRGLWHSSAKWPLGNAAVHYSSLELLIGTCMYIKVIATPGGRKESMAETSDRVFSITVREPAERNQANTRIRELLALHFMVPPGKVRILTGHRSHVKMLSIDN